MNTPLLPGATIGMLGSGQLGRMFSHAAARLGYRVHVYSPEADSPAGQVSARETVAAYDDEDALATFARSVDVVSYEFENVPAESVAVIERSVPVRPGWRFLETTRHREREKTAVESLGIAVAPFRGVRSLDDLRTGLEALGTRCILKRSEEGYDGRGQWRLADASEAERAWTENEGRECVLEGVVPFDRELSIVACRGLDGSFDTYGPIENRHEKGILDVSFEPPECEPRVAAAARDIARSIAESFEVVGVFCVELFDIGGELVVNEIAPRPHNSGHLTIEGHAVSQFEQQVRAVCGLPLGSTRRVAPSAMANLVGTGFLGGGWIDALGAEAHLHWYGKAEERPGRKMGHLTVTAQNAKAAVERALAVRRRITATTSGHPATAEPVADVTP